MPCGFNPPSPTNPFLKAARIKESVLRGLFHFRGKEGVRGELVEGGVGVGVGFGIQSNSITDVGL